MKDHKSNYSIKDTTAIPTRTLFVGNLPCNITENDLKDLFGKFGDVTDVDIKKPTSNRQGNSYAFIKFENLDIANQAKTEMSGHMVGKCQIKIGFGKVNPTNCVWVGGLGPWILYDAFEKEMIRFGIVKQIDWPHNKNYAYVLYESVDIAITAVNKLRGSHFGDETKPIKVDFADANVIKSNPNQKSDNDNSSGGGGGGGGYSNNNNTSGHGNSKHHDLFKRSNKDSTVIMSPLSNNNSKTNHHQSTAMVPSDESSLSVKSSRSISQLISCLNDVWTGMIVLKNNNFGCRLYMLKGEQSLINEFMLTPAGSVDQRNNIDNLTITQRMKLDIQKLAEMSQRIEFAGENGFCLMLASSYIVDTKLVSDSSQPQRPLKNLITYLRTKESAGVIFLKSNSNSGAGAGAVDNSRNLSGVLHAFPPCDFSFDILLQKAPNLTKDFSKDDFLVILLIRNST